MALAKTHSSRKHRRSAPRRRRNPKPRAQKVRGLPARRQPDQFYKELGKLRHEAEIVVDRLISLMDAIDAPSEDCEDDLDGEPSLAAPECHESGDQTVGVGAQRTTLKMSMTAPSLMRTVSGPSVSTHSVNQEAWAVGFGHDVEEEHDGREPDVDAEPSYASPETGSGSQLGWANSFNGDEGGVV